MNRDRRKEVFVGAKLVFTHTYDLPINLPDATNGEALCVGEDKLSPYKHFLTTLS